MTGGKNIVPIKHVDALTFFNHDEDRYNTPFNTRCPREISFGTQQALGVSFMTIYSFVVC